MRKVLLRLPDNVYDALKSNAAERGKSMNASAVELFSTFFELAASTSAQKSDSTSGDASTKSAITSEKVLADLDSASIKSDSTSEKMLADSASASIESDSSSEKVLADSGDVAITKSTSASSLVDQFASIAVISPAVLAHLSESDALSVEYVARADGRWSNTP